MISAICAAIFVSEDATFEEMDAVPVQTSVPA